MSLAILLQFDKVLLNIYGINFYWYGFSYAFSLILAMFVLRALKISSEVPNMTNQSLDSLFLYTIMGVIIGGRLGYVLLYHPQYYLQNPGEIYKTWKGGMSFHGGFIGFLFAMKLFCAKQKIFFLKLGDIIAVISPIPVFFVRIANFINSELYGKPTDVPWAVIFPEIDNMPRHPSQLYEAFTEGFLLFFIMLFLWKKTALKSREGVMSGIFLLLYSIARISCEFFRVPDSHIGYLYGPLTQGQAFCLPMMAVGLFLIFRKRKVVYKIEKNS